MTWRTILGAFCIGGTSLSRRMHCVRSSKNFGYRNLEDAKLPVVLRCDRHLVGWYRRDVGRSGCAGHHRERCSPGSVRAGALQRSLSCGWTVSSNTPVTVAVARGAQRLIVLPTGYACALEKPPAGAVANALHALTLLIARQLKNERVAGPRSQHRLFRCAAAVSADRIAI